MGTPIEGASPLLYGEMLAEVYLSVRLFFYLWDRHPVGDMLVVGFVSAPLSNLADTKQVVKRIAHILLVT